MSDYLTPSLKRALRGKTLKPITEDYTMKEVNRMLTDLLGRPGYSAGKAQQNISSSVSSGMSSSAYNAGQMDFQPQVGGSSSVSGWAVGIGLLRDIIGYYYADKAAQTAYNRQNEFYNNHLSMPAKVQEYQEAGLNPMGLSGVGAGATSAPSVQSASAPGGDALTGILSSLLDYKVAMRRADIEDRRVKVEEEKLPSMIESYFANAENKRKQVEWYDAAIGKINTEIEVMSANIDKIFAETEKVTVESFILGIQGKYADSTFKAQLANLYKDLGVKDALISKYDADAALAWANKNLVDITSSHQGALMEASISQEYSKIALNYAESALKQFEVDYKRRHAGANPPSGIGAALIGICSDMATSLTGVSVDVSKSPNAPLVSD